MGLAFQIERLLCKLGLHAWVRLGISAKGCCNRCGKRDEIRYY